MASTDRHNMVMIPISGGKDAKEYLEDLNEALAEILLMLFERRELDLQEEQCYALFVVTDLQKRITKAIG
jgi:hypothetical protein